jgi:hypothetical protein
MTTIAVHVKILTGGRERRMAEIVTHEPQVDLLARDMRPCAVPQLMRRRLLQLIGSWRMRFATGTQCVGCAAENLLDDAVQCGARQRFERLPDRQ